MTHTIHYCLHEVAGYINWLYFFHAWGFPSRYGSIARVHGCTACRQNWLQSFPLSERIRAQEAIRLFDDATMMLQRMDSEGWKTHFRVALMAGNSVGDDIVLGDGTLLPLLRQQQAPEGQPCLCLSDFVRPASSGVEDCIGLFASMADAAIEQQFPGDDYHHLLAQTLADRLAEATAERGHLLVRKELWGFSPDEELTIEELFSEAYQGKRPAVGYPSLPDQSLNFVLGDLLDFASLGISLTENGAMQPHASTSGLILSHPATCHFCVGEVGDDQLADYARRRGLSPEYCQRFLK